MSLFCSAFSYSTPKVIDPKFTTLSTKNGLSQDTVNTMLFDPDGFFWLGTAGGLNRFDGYKITAVSGPNNELADLPIFKLYMDEQQQLWISTDNSGVFRYDLANNRLKNVVSIPYAGHSAWLQYASNFTSDNQGNIYISMNESVLRYSLQNGTYTSIFNLSAQEIEQDGHIRFVKVVDSIVFVAHTGGLSAIDLNSPKRVDIDYLGELPRNIDNTNAKYLLTDSSNRFWLGTVQGLYRFPLDELLGYVKGTNPQPKATVIEPNRNIWKIMQIGEQEFVIGSDIGLLALDAKAGKVTHLLEPNSGNEELSQKDIYDIVIDSAGNYWMGTIFGGALYWSPTSLMFDSIFNSRLDTKNRPLSHNTIWTIEQTEPGYVWVGTDNGLNHLNLQTRTSDSYLVSSESNYAFSESILDGIHVRKDGKLWLRTAEGIRLFDPTAKTITPLSELSETFKDVAENPILSSILDGQGRLWLSDWNKLYRYTDDSGIEEIHTQSREFSTDKDPSLLGFLNQQSSDLLIGIHNSLWLMDTKTNRIRKIHEVPDAYQELRIVPSSWTISKSNVLWVAYASVGIFGLDATTYEQLYFFNKDNILSTNIVYGLQIDEEQNLWFSSHSGIHRYSIPLNKVSHYRYGQELNTAEFNQGAYARLTDGRFAYGSPKGLVLFDPAKIPPSVETDQRLTITDIQLSSRSLTLPLVALNDYSLQLEHDDVGLTINFSNMAFDSTQSINYHYQLVEGESVIAHSTTRLPKVTFPTLAPGDYQFRVSTNLADSSDPENWVSIGIRAGYAPWASPLAYTFYVVMVLAAVGSWHYVRQQQLIRLDNEKRKVRLFGNAFSHTQDWVVIYDEQRNPVAANASFENAFGITQESTLVVQLQSVFNRQPELQGLMFEIMQSLKPGHHCKHEHQLINNQGKLRDVVMNVTAIANVKVDSRIDYYLFVLTDVTEQKNAERQLIKIANYDNLTGLVNRSLFLDRLEHATLGSKRKNTCHAVLFIDLDRFKSVNDSLGHDFGDRLLQHVAKRMLHLTKENDTVARLGGDEFVILIEDIDQPGHLVDFIDELIRSLESPITIEDEVLRISCSVGVSMFPNDAKTAQDLLKQADVAMYSAKKDNLCGFKFFTEELNAQAQQQLQLENQIKQAFEENGFYNHYQPIVDIRQGCVAGLELLLRCTVEGKSISPYFFIPVAEELRLIIDMTHDAIERGLKDMHQWYQKGFQGYLSVNLSALHFKSAFDISKVKALLARYELPTHALRFEITESALMENTETALQKFESLRAAGFMLALDDFGTGYSSLSYLKKFPLQILKIDKSFVDDIGKDKDSDAIVLTTLGMANNLNMICVAEGIESEHQVQFFKKHGCRYIQGYYYSKPVGSEEVEALLFQQWASEA